MNRLKRRFFLVFALTGLLPVQATSAPAWQSNDLFLLHGNGYEVESEKQTTLTFEHVSGWRFGDLFSFIDVTTHHDSNTADSLYGEFSPRLSLGKTTDNNFDFGLVKDVLIAGSIEFGKGDVESLLLGVGFDLEVQGFNYVSLNILRRFTNGDRDGETIQLTPAWGMNWGDQLSFSGFIDWNINDDGNYTSNFHFNPRIEYKLGKTLGAGLEYSYWKNKYGIRDSVFFNTDQNALSLYLKYGF